MRRKVRLGFFGYLTIDHAAALAYLDRMAEGGWALAEVWLGVVARFRRTDRTDLRYYVDIAEPVREDTPEYRRRCREAGWERLYTVRYMNIYRSLPGSETTPLQTGESPALERYRRNALRWAATCAAACALLSALAVLRLFLFWMTPTGSLLWLSAASGAVRYLQTLLPAILAGGGVYLFFTLLRARQWAETAKAGRAPPAVRSAGAGARGALTALTYLGTAGLVGAITLDLVSAPTAKPLLTLALLLAAALLVTVCSSGAHMRQPKRVRVWRCVGLAALLVAMGLIRGACTPALAGLRAGLADTLPKLPEDALYQIDAGYDTLDSGGSFLLGYARETKQLDGIAAPLVVEYYNCRSGWMTARMAEDLRSWWMRPVEGMEHTWAGLSGDSWDVLSVRGREVRLVSVPLKGGPYPDGYGVLHAVPWAAEGNALRPGEADIARWSN